jgi:hypothetical protein
MSVAQLSLLTGSDQSEQPDQTAAVDEARPNELETPVRDNTVVNYGSPAHSHQALSLAILARRRLRFFAETDFGFGL